MEALFILLIFLGIITVVGHVIWLGLAAIYRWAFVDEQARYVPVVPRHDPVLSKLVDLKTTEQQIIKFHEDGKLNDQTYEEVMGQIRAERTRLVNPTPKSEKAPAPAATPKTTPAVVSVVSVASNEQAFIKPGSINTGTDTPPRVEPPPPASPRPPRRSFSEVLNAFMEES